MTQGSNLVIVGMDYSNYIHNEALLLTLIENYNTKYERNDIIQNELLQGYKSSEQLLLST